MGVGVNTTNEERGMSVCLSRSIFTVVLLASAALSTTANAQTTYPNKLVRIIVPFGPGGASDALPRLIATPLSSTWGQSVIVENRPGAAGNIGMELGAKAAPDGYTLLLGASSGLVVAPALGTPLAYDPLKDFVPIGLGVYVPFVFVIHPGVPARNVKEFVAFAKEHPGKVNVGSPGTGTPNHLGVELMKVMTGADMTRLSRMTAS